MSKWQSCEITVVNYKKNGEEFWINICITPVTDEKGQYTHWVSVDRDVTESRKLEQELKQIFDSFRIPNFPVLVLIPFLLGIDYNLDTEGRHTRK